MIVINHCHNLSKRYIQVFLLMVGFFIASGARVIVGVATVRMTSDLTRKDEDGNTGVIAPAEFDWSETTIGYVEASFFWGFALSQFPAGGLIVSYFPAHR